MGNRHPDDIDRRIIQHLQEDGRRPYTTIAKDLGLSEAGIRQRVARLIRNRSIQIVAVSNPMDLGFMRAEVLVQVDGALIDEVASEIAAMPEVDFVALCAGAYDISVGLVCHDSEELVELLMRRLRAIPGVRDARAALYLSVVKDSYQWSWIDHPQEKHR